MNTCTSLILFKQALAGGGWLHWTRTEGCGAVALLVPVCWSAPEHNSHRQLLCTAYVLTSSSNKLTRIVACSRNIFALNSTYVNGTMVCLAGTASVRYLCLGFVFISFSAPMPSAQSSQRPILLRLFSSLCADSSSVPASATNSSYPFLRLTQQRNKFLKEVESDNNIVVVSH